MFSGAVFISLILPLQVSIENPKFEPFIVQATIDAAIIAGLPPSRSARKRALISQAPEFLAKEALQAPEIVSIRRLFFRRYF